MFEFVGWALEDEHGVLSHFRLKDYWFFDMLQHDGTEHSIQDIRMSASIKAEEVKVVKIYKQVGSTVEDLGSEVEDLKIRVEKELCRILGISWSPTVSIRSLIDETEERLLKSQTKIDQIRSIVLK